MASQQTPSQAGNTGSASSSSSSFRSLLSTHALPCLLSALVGGAIAFKAAQRAANAKEAKRADLVAMADAASPSQLGLTPSQFNSAAHSLVDQVTEYRATLRSRPVRAKVKPGYLKELVPQSAPEEGEPWEAIQGDIERVIMPGITHWGSPNFYAYFPAFSGYPSLLGEFMCSALNTIGFSWIGSPASTELETLVLDWIGQMCQLPKEFLHSSESGGGGCIQGTAAEAAAVALLAARSKVFDGLTLDEIESESTRIVAYISDQTHGIVAKGCKITGVPQSRLRVLNTTQADNFSLRLETVKAAMEADEAAGLQPFFICLTIGSTSSTAIDDVRVIADWVRRRFPKVFIHIDAAYAGSFSMLDTHRHLFSGVELVDSFSFNPHKSLLVAFDCSLFYVKTRRHLLAALSLANDGAYLRNEATESGKVLDLKDWQLPFGRRFRSLKLWFTLRSFGQRGLRRHLQSAIANADRFKAAIRADPRFRLTNEPLHFALVCFELVPPVGVSLTRSDLNALNETLKESCNETGKMFFITTVLAGCTIMRLACNGENQQTTRDCDETWAIIQQQTDLLWQKQGWTAPEKNGSATVVPLGVSAASASAAGVPVIDISPLLSGSDAAGRARVAREIYSACTTVGFFYISGHGVSQSLQDDLERLSKEFFALPVEEKMKISMGHAGKAWRGYFPVGDELTSGKPDMKEGLYLGTELGPDHPMVVRGVPMHGANLFPASIPDLRSVTLAYLDAMTELGHLLMESIAQSLGLEDAQYFRKNLTHDPTVLFRIFNYPEQKKGADENTWGVGEHTDYGVLTILKQDASGGLQVRSPSGDWLDAPPVAGTFVVNIGDMLDRLTGGRFKSTPHRVRNIAAHDRLSWPFFFDPNWDAQVKPIPLQHLPEATIKEDQQQRWDRASVHTLTGTYGEYLLRKVGKVFPSLGEKVIRQY